MAVFLADDFHTIVWRQHLLQADSHAQSEHGGEGAVADGGSKLDGDLDDGVWAWHAEGRRGRDVNVGQVNDGELTQ